MTKARLSAAILVAIYLSACGYQASEQKKTAQPRDSSAQVAEPTLKDELQPISGARPVHPEVARLSSPLAESSNAPQTVRADAVELQARVQGAAKVISSGSIRLPSERLDRERYGDIDDNPIKLVSEHPVSTFSVDVDTGAYANVRRFLNHGKLPPMDAVRVEEMINYFAYDYPLPEDRSQPFSVTTQIAPSPWRADRHLLHVGIKGYEVPAEALPPANLVFLVDVSGSMQSEDKLELLKRSLKLMSRQLRREDRLSIVVYAGASGVVLEPVAGDQTATIHAALDALYAGGSTNGGAGIRLAYAMARQAYIDGGINRVVLATDGDFNVGTVDFDKLKDLVERERTSGVSLTTLGFGSGNYNEHLMEQLADAGNGNHAYIDTLREANKVLVQQMSGTLNTIAKDVKIQIEFNPARVTEYRLIGYENRLLRREDFNNDRVDAGEIGSGHTVTALYEIALAGSGGDAVDPLRYSGSPDADPSLTDEIAFLKMRYKAPDGDESRLLQWPLAAHSVLGDFEAAGAEFRFAAAVAGFGQLLRGGKYTGGFSYDDVLELARDGRSRDPFGYRSEFLSLVSLAQSLDPARR